MQLSPDVLDKQDISQQHAIGHLSTDTETHYLAHEVGHLAHDKKLEKVDYDDVEYNQTWKDVLDGEYLEGIYTMEELIKDNVGNYAAASPNDFVVETWVGLIHGNQYNDTILQLYDDLNGPGVPQW
jgi:hypothetical protein